MADFRIAWRSVRRNPIFAVSAIGVLAVVIGLATAVFSVAQGVLLRPLPYPAPNELVVIGRTRPSAPALFGASLPDYADWREWASPWLQDIGVFGTERMAIIVSGSPQEVSVGLATPSLWSTLRVTPLVGRLPVVSEIHGDRKPTLISERLWRSRFGGSRDAIGQIVPLVGSSVGPGETAEIVGVLPESAILAYLDTRDLFLPLEIGDIDRSGANTLRRLAGYRVVGRLRDGVSLETVTRELGALRPTSFGEHTADDRIAVRSLYTWVVGSGKRSMTLLSAAVGLVVLVGIANFSGLLLLQVQRRRRQLATLVALGATQLRVCRLLVIEAFGLSAAGTLLGIIIAPLLLKLIESSIPIAIPRIGRISVDNAARLFAGISGFLLSAAGSLLPAWRTAQHSIQSTVAEPRTRVARTAVLTVQFSVVVWLTLTAAGLLVALWRVTFVSMGFEPGGLTVLQLNPRYQTSGRSGLTPAIYNTLIDGLLSEPQISNASIVYPPPFYDFSNVATIRTPRKMIGDVTYIYVRPRYFSTMGINVLAGRDFQASESGADRIAIVSAALARQAFDGASPLGESLTGTLGTNRVVGVVADARYDSLLKPVKPAIYLPFQSEITAVPWLMVRWTYAHHDLATALKAPARALLPADIALGEPVPLASWVDSRRADNRFFAMLVTMFAGTTTLLAAAGMFASTALASRSRRKEIAIRACLGATRGSLIRMLGRESLIVVAVGLMVGHLCNVLTARSVTAVVQGVVTDAWPVTLFVTATMTTSVMFVALLPAWKLTRDASVDALRAE